jgi:membrane protein required for beta-lactamase induction
MSPFRSAGKAALKELKTLLALLLFVTIMAVPAVAMILFIEFILPAWMQVAFWVLLGLWLLFGDSVAAIYRAYRSAKNGDSHD